MMKTASSLSISKPSARMSVVPIKSENFKTFYDERFGNNTALQTIQTTSKPGTVNLKSRTQKNLKFRKRSQ